MAIWAYTFATGDDWHEGGPDWIGGGTVEANGEDEARAAAMAVYAEWRDRLGAEGARLVELMELVT